MPYFTFRCGQIFADFQRKQVADFSVFCPLLIIVCFDVFVHRDADSNQTTLGFGGKSSFKKIVAVVYQPCHACQEQQRTSDGNSNHAVLPF